MQSCPNYFIVLSQYTNACVRVSLAVHSLLLAQIQTEMPASLSALHMKYQRKALNPLDPIIFEYRYQSNHS
jgi:hypothetical protein